MVQYKEVLFICIGFFLTSLFIVWWTYSPSLAAPSGSKEVEKLSMALAKAVLRGCRIQFIGGCMLFLLFYVIFYDCWEIQALILLFHSFFVLYFLLKVRVLAWWTDD